MFRNCHLKIFVAVLSVSQILCEDQYQRQPVYKYRYETEDMMKTSASQAPVRGYHVVEGGYYPQESGLIGSAVGPIGAEGFGLGANQFIGPLGVGGGYSGGSIGYSGIGGAGLGHGGIGSAGLGHGGLGGVGIGVGGLGGGGAGIGLGAGGIGLQGGVGGPIGVGGIGYGHHTGPQFIGGGGVGAGIGAAGLGGGYIAPVVHGYGGEEVEKSEFSGGKKNLNDVKFEKSHANKGEQINHGQQGYSQGGQVVKDVKGEEGYYKNAAGGKNVIEDGKQYQGGQNYNQEGNNGAENKAKKGHKKGHVIKGFKSSHHKDESGKTEEYYDEENDEGDNYAFNGQNGAFGQKGQSSYKGGHEDGKFNEQEHKKTGLVSNQYAVNKENSDHGKYGENKYAGAGSAYGVNNGIDQQSLLGHQENSRFFKHHPVPFYHH